jgi:AcrR family transcriptional regulator
MAARGVQLRTPAASGSAAAEAEALTAAMAVVVAQHGYGGASVARVLERAGLSRQTFYNHYPTRDDCCLAAYRSAAAEVGGRLRAAARQSAPADRFEATIAALLDVDRAALRMLLVDALGGCAAVRAEHERQLGGIERLIGRFLATPGAPKLQVPAIALLGGICGVVSERILSDHTLREEDLLEGLVAWVRSYERTDGDAVRPLEDEPETSLARPVRRAAGPPGAAEVRLLPRGRSALPPDLADGTRRSRILEATRRQVAALGYERLTVADIVADARIPRASFYTHFSGKQEAFLAAQATALRESIARAAAEYVTGATWPERGWRGLGALLEYVATHPAHARLGFVEVHAAGPAAVAQHEEMRGAYTLFLADGYRQRAEAARLPQLRSQAIAGAIEAIVRGYVVRGRTDRLRDALPRCAYVALAPFVGPEAALSWVEERTRAAG